MHIRRLLPADAAAFQALRLHALRQSPAAFSASFDEECATPITVVASQLAPDSARHLFGAFDGEQLVGMVGLGRDQTRKQGHKGFIRGMFVDAAYRQHGLARQLLAHLLEHAALQPGLRQLTLVVGTDNAPAMALYTAMGFKPFGLEPESLLVDGVLHDDLHMVHHLHAAG